ncbi:kunitz/Bovine pancreatic trypsin inhibitor domain-containing protein [Ditylenchus destructor]|nr:kunitz/Bovine pancreatic trypsin inhibitor domain-containing protein [Ditylenchus destructor]
MGLSLAHRFGHANARSTTYVPIARRCRSPPIDDDCPIGYECINSIGKFSDKWDGVCCPTKATTCSVMPEISSNGWLERWFFNGSACEKFLWDPESTITSNTFQTEEHCLSYCTS